MTNPAGLRVLVAGATSESGRAVCEALTHAGMHAIAVGRNNEKLEALAAAVPGIETLQADLGDATSVAELAKAVHGKGGPIDGLVNLVGGWAGGKTLTDQSDSDWDFLSVSLTALRNTSRAFFADLSASAHGRIAIVSSVAVNHPRAAMANYATLKAAAETWLRATVDGFHKEESAAAGTIFVARTLSGHEEELANGIVGMFGADGPAAGTIARIEL